MIFVTVGSSTIDFSRLLRKMDEIAGKIDEQVIMQIGHSKYSPTNSAFFRFEPNEGVYDEYIKQARILVCHAGIGSIIKGINYSKPIIVVPRKKKFHEIGDDHQEDTATALQKEGLITSAEINDLEDLLKIQMQPIKINCQEHNSLVMKLKLYINSFDH